MWCLASWTTGYSRGLLNEGQSNWMALLRGEETSDKRSKLVANGLGREDGNGKSGGFTASEKFLRAFLRGRLREL
jgi:hypothetical protein